jgi:V/A-type H+-transporting ATPase subunit F
MMPVRQMNIAVLGDRDLVSGLRLAGIKRYHVVQEGEDIREELRQVLAGFINEANIGIVALQEDYLPYVEDLVQKLRAEKRLTPIVIEVPSKYGTKYEDVGAYYRDFVRRFVGFDIQV